MSLNNKKLNIFAAISILATAIFSILLVGCNTNEDEPGPSSPKAYIRFFDIQHGINYTLPNTAMSALLWDGYYYGNPELDSIKIPKYNVRLFGDFIMGRAEAFFRANGVDISTRLFVEDGGIDYYGAGNQMGDYFGRGYPNADIIWRSGLDGGRKVYFPNLSHVVPVAPIQNGIDYYKWAAMDAGTHAVGFKKIKVTSIAAGRSLQYTIDSANFISKQMNFDEGGTYSVFLSNLDHKGSVFTLFSIKENVNQTFDQQKGYIRFVNTIPLPDDVVSDPATDVVDVYLQRYSQTISGKDSTTDESLSVANLKRFSADSEISYIPLEYIDFYNQNKGKGILKYYFKVYPQGQSSATGASPLSIHVMTMFGSAYSGEGETVIPILFKKGSQYIPTIHTVLLGSAFDGVNTYLGNALIRNMYYSLESADVRQQYLDEASGN